MGRTRPAVVITVGGYASVAAALAAVVWRIPLVVAEQNAVPGLANRLAGRFAAACAVSFPGTPLPPGRGDRQPGAAGRSWPSTGRPRGRAAARAALGLPADGLVVAAAGGSLGARRINEAVLGVWPGLGGPARPGHPPRDRRAGLRRRSRRSAPRSVPGRPRLPAGAPSRIAWTCC